MTLPDTSLQDLLLLYRTASNLNWGQILGVADRKLRHALLPRFPVDFDARYESRIPATLSVDTSYISSNTEKLRKSLTDSTRHRYRAAVTQFMNGTIEFLNRSIEFGSIDELSFESAQIDSYPGLWRLKLHALTPVRWITLGYNTPANCPSSVIKSVRRFISKWVDETSIGNQAYLRRRWVPHAVSLRILTLIRFYSWLDTSDATFAQSLRHLIYKNTLFLENHIEYDVGGNHLIENAAALLTAGVFFSEGTNTWRENGLAIFKEAADQQFLRDGGHFERSPMYHKLALQRYLTAADLLSVSENTVPSNIHDIAVSGTKFLMLLTPPNNQIPLLNDAALNEFLSLEACLDYAERVGISPTEDDLFASMDASGYYWLGDGANQMLFDCGDVGPDHLPGHSHNDMLSVLLWLDGTQILTDTGAYEYVSDEMRRYVRGISSHNTVQVARRDPIPVGGQYLMGRRCHPTSRVRRNEDGVDYFTGWYNTGGLVRSAYSHRRDVVTGGNWWVVSDNISGATNAEVQAHLHFHPNVELVSEQGGYQIRRTNIDDTQGLLQSFGTHSVTETTTPYFPRFGEKVERPALRLLYDRMSAPNGFVIIADPTVPISVDTQDTDELVLTIDSIKHEINLPSYDGVSSF